MSKICNLVIGANYGDEGKGLVTNQITPSNGVVVLTNGGAQHGHTAIFNGLRHVFHHFGAASLKGAASYACDDFIVNPAEFARESEELNFVPKFFASPQCRISTIYDMFANSLRARTSGTNTTGFGIYETITRYEAIPSLRLLDFVHCSTQAELLAMWNKELDKIVKYYEDIYGWQAFFHNAGTREHMLGDLLFFFSSIAGIVSFTAIANMFDTITFEQGQGLALDTDYDIEYGTPTHTGSHIPAALIKDLDCTNMTINTYYVSRSYITRHGDGYMNGGAKKQIFDLTNQDNPYQGAIKACAFNQSAIDDMLSRIKTDMAILPAATAHLVLTHTNEVDRPAVQNLCAQIQAGKQSKIKHIHLSDNDKAFN